MHNNQLIVISKIYTPVVTHDLLYRIKASQHFPYQDVKGSTRRGYTCYRKIKIDS